MVTLVSVLRHSMKTDFEDTKTEVGSETCDQNKSRIEKKNVFFCRSIGIYMDTINIFIRILTIMASSNTRRRKQPNKPILTGKEEHNDICLRQPSHFSEYRTIVSVHFSESCLLPCVSFASKDGVDKMNLFLEAISNISRVSFVYLMSSLSLASVLRYTSGQIKNIRGYMTVYIQWILDSLLIGP